MLGFDLSEWEKGEKMFLSIFFKLSVVKLVIQRAALVKK